ncbi:MAG: TetR/AcrR family transcriptional regulator [Desulfomonile sp.]|nr:TetR/AcrR family transcriptional regulator [Desulfomonile sp.]
MQPVSGNNGYSLHFGGEGPGLSTRWRILSAAEEIMSEKGLAGFCISEIARKAGVTDSVIYQYYKGKQDLLFSIPAERMKEVMSLLQEQLSGIQDVWSRLRKMVWFHLRYNDTYRGYARLLLLECRSSKAFYSTPAYKLVRQYAGILLSILEQGVKEGRFRSDVNARLIRDIVLGALDMETIGALASKEVGQSETDFEDFMRLVESMIVVKRPTDEARINRADAIMNAAEKVFAEKDFTSATIGQIAKLAGVADGTIYEHFENKEDILFSLAAKRFDTFLADAGEVFEIRNPARKLRRMIKFHFSSFLSERQFLKVFLLQLQLSLRFYGSKAYDTFRTYFQLVEEVIEEGKAAGVFYPEVNARVFRNMFLGAFSHMALRWLILHESTDTDRMEEINQVTQLLSAAVSAGAAQDAAN